MTREEATRRILEAKQNKALTFEQIAQAVGRHKVWTTAALVGQATMSKEESERAVERLVLGADVAEALQQIPLKGSLDETVPVMRAIDFTMDIERVPDPHGDRVKVTYNGKFLPYRKW